MTDIIWIVLVLSGILFAFITGNIDKLGNIILNSSNDAFNIFLNLSLMIFLWSGLFNILFETNIIQKISKKFSKILKFLFPDLNNNSKALEYISITLVCNILGLGVASTSTGLKAFELLKEEANDKSPTRSMITFILLNISSFTIFPASILTIRSNYNGEINLKFILLIMFTTFFTTIITIIIDKIFYKLGKKK